MQSCARDLCKSAVGPVGEMQRCKRLQYWCSLDQHLVTCTRRVTKRLCHQRPTRPYTGPCRIASQHHETCSILRGGGSLGRGGAGLAGNFGRGFYCWHVQLGELSSSTSGFLHERPIIPDRTQTKYTEPNVQTYPTKTCKESWPASP